MSPAVLPGSSASDRPGGEAPAAIVGGSVAVLVVRDGQLPTGAEECVAEAGGRAFLVGDGLDQALEELDGCLKEVWTLEWSGPWSPPAVAAVLIPSLRPADVVLTPATPDGRDLAPHLALGLERPLLAGVSSARSGRTTQDTHGGRSLTVTTTSGPIVATMMPGVRSVPTSKPVAPLRHPVDTEGRHTVSPSTADGPGGTRRSPELVAIHPPDASTMDLSEATSILGGGAGLGGADDYELLARVAEALGASVGATRVVTDQGTLGHERQIGTTGVVVNPDRYVAFGISGAVQHTAGLGSPDLVVSVNTDSHAPMMAMADLALTADAPAVLRALARALGLEVAEASA